MAIKLRVISDHHRDLAEQRSRVFGVNGGTIGRAPDNDWILPDPKRLVSGHHCEIEYRGGDYWLTDTSTNGVFVNDADDPVAESGPVVLKDGDRLRLGDYEIVVGIDERIDFLPTATEEQSAAQHNDSGIGASLDVNSLFKRRDASESGSMSVRNAFGIKVPKERRRAASAAPKAEPAAAEPPAARPARRRPAERAADADAPPAAADWALKTRSITRQELADALARRQSRLDARQQTLPYHQQATTWADLKSSVQAFCRGAGIDPASLSQEAQSMLPLLAGQLLREAAVGLNDLQQARAGAASGPVASGGAIASGSNPLRSSGSVEEALQRLFESHGRVYGGPVEALRDVLQDAKDHETAVKAALRAGLEALLGQLAPANVADQFEQGRARALAPGQDPRPRYWEHYTDLYRVVTQNQSGASLPHSFEEAFNAAYERVRADLRAERGGNRDAG